MNARATASDMAAERITRALSPLGDDPRSIDGLVVAIGDARFVLLGEPTHGTDEVYRLRASITRRLLAERGFDAVAIEADWPDALRVNEYVRRRGTDPDGRAALGGFAGRFPTWMWRNEVVLDFVEWLRHAELDVGFYGLDLYSMYASIALVLRYLDANEPAAAVRARERYACLERFGADTSRYAMEVGPGGARNCAREVTEQLVELRARVLAERNAGSVEADELFAAEQNARLVQNAEAYYRCMFEGSVTTWNLRDRHMADTLDDLASHLDRRLGRPCKIVVWAHNSHLGDARATEMGALGERNVGQLVRERYGRDAFLVGFTTYEGTVTAASDWDRPAEVKRLRPALDGSFEALFHRTGVARFLLLPDARRALPVELERECLERAIGVVYRPRSERTSHWFHARLARQFDAVVHVDRTTAVVPLEPGTGWHGGEAPETFPFAV